MHLPVVSSGWWIPSYARRHGDSNCHGIHAVGVAALCHPMPSLEQEEKGIQACSRKFAQGPLYVSRGA